MEERIKVGVLTHSTTDNYGANLQALSTGMYLRKSGFDPIFIKWNPYPYNANREQVKLHNTFLQRHGFELTDNCKSDDEFVSCINKCGIHNIIVGSDCIFTYLPPPTIPYRLTRKGICKVKILEDWAFPNPFWLPFFNKIKAKTFIMSGSCGASDLKNASNKVKEEMNSLLNNFSYISVRDEYTKESLRGILGDNRCNGIPITPDPVFSFNNNYKDLLDKGQLLSRYNIPNNYVTMGFYQHSMPSKKWLMEFKTLLNAKGYALVNLPMPQANEEFIADINVPLPLDPIEWYYLIAYSDGYIGNNMHPIIVCMHNCVPFYSINAHGKFSRIWKKQNVSNTKEYELLNRFNMLSYHMPICMIDKLSPLDVIESLFQFDMNRCQVSATILQEEYNAMMDDIVKLIV